MVQAVPDGIRPQLGLFVSALGRALRLGQGGFQPLKVGQHQLNFNSFNVRERIDHARNVNHVGIFKAAHHLQDGVDLTNMAQELVPQPFPLTGPLDDARNINQP